MFRVKPCEILVGKQVGFGNQRSRDPVLGLRHFKTSTTVRLQSLLFLYPLCGGLESMKERPVSPFGIPSLSLLLFQLRNSDRSAVMFLLRRCLANVP